MSRVELFATMFAAHRLNTVCDFRAVPTAIGPVCQSAASKRCIAPTFLKVA